MFHGAFFVIGNGGEQWFRGAVRVVLGPWNTDNSVLLGTPTCDNARNAELRGLLDSRRVKFTRHSVPGSLEQLNLRVSLRAGGCVHCRCSGTLVGHGFLRGLAPTGNDIVTRGLRMFCSDRYSNRGCGRTFPVYWDDVIPFATLRTVQIIELIRALASAPSPHAGWAASKLLMSLSSAYRWLARWKRSGTSLLTWLGVLTAPPRKTDGEPDPLHLRHLDTAFPSCPCPAAAFQNRFQIPVAP